jgi:hypothetical protein
MLHHNVPDGCCILAAVLKPSLVFLANVCDCRAVLVSRFFITNDIHIGSRRESQLSGEAHVIQVKVRERKSTPPATSLAAPSPASAGASPLVRSRSVSAAGSAPGSPLIASILTSPSSPFYYTYTRPFSSSYPCATWYQRGLPLPASADPDTLHLPSAISEARVENGIGAEVIAGHDDLDNINAKDAARIQKAQNEREELDLEGSVTKKL